MIRKNDASDPAASLRLLVTGAGGFIGTHAVEQLACTAKSVVALTGPGDTVRDWPDNVVTAEIDICDYDSLISHVNNVDVIVHLAGPPSVRESFQGAKRYLDIHAGGTTNLLQAAKSFGVKRVVYVSSAEVYGQPLHNPVDENHPLQARSPYGAAKIGAESMVEAFARWTRMSAIILRPFSVYGPGQSMNSLLGTIIRQLRDSTQIKLADLEPIRDYLHVSDLVLAIQRCCLIQVDGVEKLNLGSGKGISVAQFAQIASEVMGLNASIEQAPTNDRPDKGRIVELVSDCRRASRVLGWSTKVSFEEGLRTTIESGAKA